DKRAKEVGLRKILGASSLQAMWSLTLDFVKLIIVGAVLAIPFVLWGGQMWLNDYRVRIVISPSMVVLPIALVAVLSVLVIAEKCWRAASINPITIVRERN
ncbi:MAG: FtsX-like permease family protein, partial [Bacteroidota bacterium]